MAKKVYKPEVIAKVVALVHGGASLKEAAKSVRGLHHLTVDRWVKNADKAEGKASRGKRSMVPTSPVERVRWLRAEAARNRALAANQDAQADSLAASAAAQLRTEADALEAAATDPLPPAASTGPAPEGTEVPVPEAEAEIEPEPSGVGGQ